jgi:hypothetical protein
MQMAVFEGRAPIRRALCPTEVAATGCTLGAGGAVLVKPFQCFF